MKTKQKEEKNKWKFSLSHFILCAVFTTIITVIFVLKLALISYPVQVNNIVYDYDKQKTMDLIENIAWNVSQAQEYKRGSYDCKNFSRDLVMNLSQNNLMAYCIWGYVNYNNSWSKHQWVEIIIDNQVIPLEATNGFIIDNQIYYSDYIILSRGWCF